MPFSFPRVYPILDSSFIPTAGRESFLGNLSSALSDNGVTLLEYRNKLGSDAEVCADCEILRRYLHPALEINAGIKLILDDRVHLVERVGFDGVHVDAGDVSVAEARRLLGPERIVGTFAGPDSDSGSLIPGILSQPADYFAIGPVFATTTKQTDKPPIGIEGVRRLREEAGPQAILTAAAGITFETAPLVIEAGASAVAVAAAIFSAANPALEFRRWRERLG
jgi:thiamine-phosphate pyrophosphorylase